MEIYRCNPRKAGPASNLLLPYRAYTAPHEPRHTMRRRDCCVFYFVRLISRSTHTHTDAGVSTELHRHRNPLPAIKLNGAAPIATTAIPSNGPLEEIWEFLSSFVGERGERRGAGRNGQFCRASTGPKSRTTHQLQC